MPVALTTINAAKEQSSTYQPILLADFLFCDGSVHFISDTIDSRAPDSDSFDYHDGQLTSALVSSLGIYQLLGIRNDNRPVVGGF